MHGASPATALHFQSSRVRGEECSFVCLCVFVEWVVAICDLSSDRLNYGIYLSRLV